MIRYFIAGVMNGPNFFKQINLADQSIHIQAGRNYYRNIMIWQKRNGQWKLLARQGYKVN